LQSDLRRYMVDMVFGACGMKRERVRIEDVVGGVSILCGGTRDQKVQAAFDFISHDSYVNLDEFKAYLRSTFRVIMCFSKNQLSTATADELADATAVQGFKDADLNNDGRLSVEEFTIWYTGNMGLQEGEKEKDEQSEDNLKVSRSTSLLANIPISEVSKFYKPYATGNYITHSNFVHATNELLTYLSGGGKIHKNTLTVYEKIWNLLPTDNGIDGFSEDRASMPALIAALTVVCGGTKESKVEEAFRMFDVNGNGEISLPEMTAYLTAVFDTLSAMGGGTKGTGGDAKGEAKEIAKMVFEQADKAKDGRITLKEFKEWYMSPESEGIKIATESDAVTMATVREMVGLERVPVKTLFEIFAEGADEDGVIDRKTFHECFDVILSQTGGSLTKHQQNQAHIQINRLFDIFATEDSPLAVSFDEVASGLSIIAGGDRDDKIQAAFDLYDINDDGFISFDEMYTYMASIFKVLFELRPKIRDHWKGQGIGPQALGEIVAAEAFREADLNKDGRLSFDEFKKWYTNNQMGGGQDPTEYDPEVYDLESGGTHPVTMEEVQKITGLEDQHVEDVFELFASHADEEGYLNKESFFDCFATLIRGRIEALDAKDYKRVLFVVESLFQAVDLNGDGRIDYCELASGISVLCGGGRDDKVRAAFSLFDLNGDGFISLDEMVTYLTSMFSMLYSINPSIEDEVGTGPKELAVQTARQAFVDADLNRDGRLSFEEFTRWYLTVDTVEGKGKRDEEGEEDDYEGRGGQDQQEITLSELRKLTTFKMHSPEEVFDAFARCTDERGMMNRESFLYGISMFVVKSEDPQIESYLDQFKVYLANGLFDAYMLEDPGGASESGDVELIDFSEVCSGISVLCGGKRDDKALAAFRLYDVEGLGVISLEDLSVYLSAVFKLLFWLQPKLQMEYKVEPEELGDVTAKESFEEMGVQESEGMSFKIFQEWYSKTGNFAGEVDDTPAPAPSTAESTSAAYFHLPIQDIRRITKLNSVSCVQVVKYLAESCDDQGLIDVANLFRFFVNVYREATGDQNHMHNSTHQDLKNFTIGFFKMFDPQVGHADGSVEKIRFSEVACALTVLAGGSKRDKVDLSFQCFDADMDGMLNTEEVTNLMATVFKVLYLSNPDAFNDLGTTPTELAVVTASTTIEDGGAEGGMLTLEQFRKWYETNEDYDEVEDEEEAEEGDDDEEDEEGEEEEYEEEDGEDEDDEGIGPNIRKILIHKQHLLGLNSVTVDDLLEILSESAPSGNLNKSGFLKCISNITALSGSPASGKVYTAAMDLAGRIFESFDSGEEGSVDFAELTSGLSVLCNSDADDKVITTFTIHDSDGDGNLTLEETTHFVTNVFRVLYECADLVKVFGVGPVEMANITARRCWDDAKVVGGVISIKELITWIKPMGI